MPQMANRIQETTTTGGTGTLTLAGAVTGYLTFASGFSTGTSLFYTIDNGIGEWEIGIGTLVTTGTLSRVTVIASSNGGALVNFGSGTKRVFCSAPTRSLVPDQDSKSGYVLTTDGTDPAWTQTLNGITIGNLTAAGGAFTTLSASSTVSGTGFSTYLASPPAIGGTTPAAGAFTTLSASSTVSGTGFITYLASPPAIGGTTPAAGKFTTLEATGNTTLGDAAGDTLTINGTAVSAPNGLNVNSNQLVLSGGNVGIGTSSPGAKLDIVGATSNQIRVGTATTEHYRIGRNASDGFLDFYGSQTGFQGYRFGGIDGTWATIDSSGNVGIGTSSPNAKIHAYSATGSASLYLQNGASTRTWKFDSFSDGNLYIGIPGIPDAATFTPSGNLGLGVAPSAWISTAKTFELGGNGANYLAFNTTSRNGFVYCNAYFNGTSNIYKNNGLATAYGQVDGVHQWYTAPSGTAGGAISFTQAMTLDASGNLLVGDTSSAGTRIYARYGGAGVNTAFFRFDSTDERAVVVIRHDGSSGATSRGAVRFENSGGTQVGYIACTGSATTYVTTSDQRLKTNIAPAGSAIQSILDFPVDQFDWISSGEHQDFGGIAQKIIPIIPEMVSVPEDPEEMMGVDWSKAVPRLIRAYQELHAEIETLKQRIK